MCSCVQQGQGAAGEWIECVVVRVERVMTERNSLKFVDATLRGFPLGPSASNHKLHGSNRCNAIFCLVGS
jgi:hypothetical protein